MKKQIKNSNFKKKCIKRENEMNFSKKKNKERKKERLIFGAGERKVRSKV
jgi:hypothetical protein